MKGLKKGIVVVLIAVFALSIPSAALGHPSKKEVDYVAFGDSLAFGITPSNGVGKGYPQFLTERLEQSQYTVDFNNFSFPGDQSSDLVNAVQSPEAQQEIAEAEYITVNIGANDILPLLTSPANIPAALSNLGNNLFFALGTIDQINPNAKVYVMGYYNPFPNLPENQLAPLLPILDQLNAIIQQATAANGDTYVPTETIIAKRYQTYLPNPSNIHLSESGYQAIAKEFWKKLDKSKN
ncbi:hypothetical protein EQV77_06635 [Halobacillus fulvus]|nr:hypothetical protein EQV77_06635 [Halobacillus fulvus]